MAVAVAVFVVIAGWFFSPIISKFLGVLYDDCIKGHSSWKKDVEKLESSLPQIKAVVERWRGWRVLLEENHGLIEWLQQLKDALEDAEKILGEVEYMRKQKEVKAGKNKVSTPALQFRNFVKQALFRKRFKKAVDDLK